MSILHVHFDFSNIFSIPNRAPTPFPTPLSPTTARRATTPGRLATPHTPLAQQGPASFPTPTPLQPQGVQ
ncbi:hypothetical protein BC826DRAFT_1102807 [Russula brevipes]|nr:hypothetical protein BC826DRAFT_1102807 [Russula brevipes]